MSKRIHVPITIRSEEYVYKTKDIVGKGSFGVVYKVECKETKEIFAIKKVMQDTRFKNRELQILKKLHHPNIVELKESFYGREHDQVFLHLVMEHVKETIHACSKAYVQSKELMPLQLAKSFIYQLARSLAYLHSLGVCHRDIKPQNLLVDADVGILKLCDFGSAKNLGPGESSVFYICSRYYRAPELILKATKYTTAIDLWSVGCVLGEVLIGEPVFPGKNAFSQLVEIIRVIGTPTEEQLELMNEDHEGITFKTMKKGKSWESILGEERSSPEVVDLLENLLCYEPLKRLKALEICAHPFFDSLREEGATLHNGESLPSLFDFSEDELKDASPSLRSRLIPVRMRANYPDTFFE